MLQKVCLWKWFCCICFRKFWRVSLPTFAPVAWSFLVMGDNISACISSISYSDKRFYIVRFTPFQRRTQNPVKHLTSNFRKHLNCYYLDIKLWKKFRFSRQAIRFHLVLCYGLSAYSYEWVSAVNYSVSVAYQLFEVYLHIKVNEYMHGSREMVQMQIFEMKYSIFFLWKNTVLSEHVWSFVFFVVFLIGSC